MPLTCVAAEKVHVVKAATVASMAAFRRLRFYRHKKGRLAGEGGVASG